jgi:hypothetical protein
MTKKFYKMENNVESREIKIKGNFKKRKDKMIKGNL